MSHTANLQFAPFTGCDVRAYLGGTDDDIPCVEFGFDESYYMSPVISIQLGNHDEPTAWLRRTADRLVELADQIAVQQAAAAKAVEA